MGENEIKDTVMIGDKAIDKDAITPAVYFDYVKGLKEKLNQEEYNIIIDTSLKMLNKTKITGQTAMAAEISHEVELALRELDAAKEGFDIYVNRKDIEKYIDSVESNSIKIIELENYTREIPDDQVDKIVKAKEIFDQLYIIFTDYTMEDTKKVAKERRDKDPIVFGAFLDKDDSESTSKIYVEDRLFFICDWIEEKCDLTLEQICRDVKDKDDKDITYKVSNPKTEDEVKKYLKSFSEPVEEQEPAPIFTTVKEKAKAVVKKTIKRKKSTSSTTKRRKKTTE